MPTIEVPRATLYFETTGEKGPWITLFNGHTRSSKDFRLLSKHLADAGFQCLTFDNRGSGQTKTTGSFTARDMVQDVYALWDQFGIKKSFLIGISMGGMLSEMIAAERDISGLVLISTAAGEKELAEKNYSGWGQSVDEVGQHMAQYFTPEFAARNKLLIEAMNKQIFQAIQEDNFVEKAESQRKAIKDLDNTALLKKISCPTLILHGSVDRIIPVEAAHKLNQGIAGSDLKIIEGAGHLLLAEDSKRLSQEIIGFCQANRT